ncbi:MAG: hypothetical protein ACJ768_16275 [Gaiellaceae bacterium]
MAAAEEPAQAPPEHGAGSTGYVTREAIGLTLIGVLVNIGVTVGLAVNAAWWVSVCAGIAAPVVLVVLLKASHHHIGAMKRLADWLTH